MSRDPFAGGPRGRRQADRVEAEACVEALRLGAFNRALFYRRLGDAKPTFAALRDHAEFPRTPVVSGDAPDAVGALFTRFRQSAVWREWVAARDEAAAVRPGFRAVVMRGAGWGLVVVHDSRTVPQSPHVRVGHDFCDGGLVIEPFASWCRGIGWEPAPDLPTG